MSWSVQIIGTPERVIAKLDEVSGKFYEPDTNQSKKEYDEALPHLKALVALNLGGNQMVKLVASGHGSFVNGAKVQGAVTMELSGFYGDLAI